MSSEKQTPTWYYTSLQEIYWGEHLREHVTDHAEPIPARSQEKKKKRS